MGQTQLCCCRFRSVASCRCTKVSATLTQITLREKHAVGGGVEGGQELAGEVRLDAAGFFGMDQVLNDGFEPGVFAHPKEHGGSFPDFEMVDGCAREQVAVNFDLFDH